MKVLFLISIFLSYKSSFCQSIDLKALNQTIKIGICRTETERCKQTQIEYVNACGDLGDYYFKLKKYNKALNYYMQAANLGVYTDGELQDDKVIKLRNTIAAKAGDIFFYGYGVKKNKVKAFFLYNKVPTFYSQALSNRYSELYFGDSQHFYPLLIDSIQYFAINPFYLKDTTSYSYFQSCLSDVESKMQDDPELICKVELTYGLLKLNIVNQGYLNRVLDLFKQYIDKPYINKFSFELLTSEKGLEYKSLILPRLSIKLISRNG